MEAYEKWRAKAYVHANGLFYDLVVCGSDSERHPEGYDAQARHIPENLYYGGTSSFDINSAGNNGVNAWPACIALSLHVIHFVMLLKEQILIRI